ncbi:ABC transporter permease [Alteribacillus iranensis]|uniref:Iron(III) transport system permease protein n=1 Tax=Alteribacillus iranensis TaxID=930128 RepID=A0A1I2DIE9_9BACI|nr:hypothetical protein [Alteribacillus iranensis]SFE80218.1 iron(III) transport system permease protein [Alteribacillus iranensis]
MKYFSLQTLNKYGAFLALGLLVLLPITLVLLRAFMPEGSFEGLAPLAVLGEPYYREVLWNSLLLGGGVVIGASLLAAPLAFLMARTDLKRHRWLDVLIMVPFMTPPYIGSMGWILAMQPNGYIEQLLPFMSSVTPLFFTYYGMVLVMSLHLFPFIYIIMRNTLSNIGGRLEEAGSVHGGKFFYRM